MCKFTGIEAILERWRITIARVCPLGGRRGVDDGRPVIGHTLIYDDQQTAPLMSADTLSSFWDGTLECHILWPAIFLSLFDWDRLFICSIPHV